MPGLMRRTRRALPTTARQPGFSCTVRATRCHRLQYAHKKCEDKYVLNLTCNAAYHAVSAAMQVTGVIGVSQPETVSSAQSQRKANKLNAQIQTTSAAPGERPESLLETILASLDESKAEETTHIDIVGKSPVADHMIVTSGRSHRHVNAVTDRLLRDLKDAVEGSPKVEGVPACDWVLVDTGDVIVHIFRPEVRDFYNLEKLWSTIAEGEMA